MKRLILLIHTILISVLSTSGSYFNLPLTANATAYSDSYHIFNIGPYKDSVANEIRSSGNWQIYHEFNRVNKKGGVKTIVIDAGHGGRDGGCSGSESKEKVIALKIALEFGKRIEQQYPDVKVVYTRKTDVFIPLHKRTKIANDNQADLFVSIHCNYIPNASQVNGSETYVMGLHKAEHNLEVAKRENEVIYLEDNYSSNYGVDPNSPEGHIILSAYQHAFLEQSILFAEKIEKNVKNYSSHRSRGVKQAGFYVLKNTTMPSVLVETGYLSNAKDQQFLLSSTGQHQIAASLLKAFAEFKGMMDTDLLDDAVYVQTEASTTGSGASDSQATKPKNETISDYTPSPAKTRPDAPAIRTAIQETGSENTDRHAESEAVISMKKRDVEFRIQLAASKKQIERTEKKWLTLAYAVKVIKEGDYFKYQIPQIYTFAEAVEIKRRMRNAGFTGAFLVAYQNEQKIGIERAKVLSANN